MLIMTPPQCHREFGTLVNMVLYSVPPFRANRPTIRTCEARLTPHTYYIDFNTGPEL